jgi:organic hydroperoxide reductase OsmC/OhrA
MRNFAHASQLHRGARSHAWATARTAGTHIETTAGAVAPPYTERAYTGAVAARSRASYKESMSEHKMTLKWERGGAEFSYQKYPRDHTWAFDGGHTMTATAAPAYLGNPANVDPEEAFVAALSSCHMLTFLAIACKQKFVLDSYEDEAVGYLEKNAAGRLAITRVELRPRIAWSGERKPTAEELERMHHAAHENCFIANSVTTQVTVKGT